MTKQTIATLKGYFNTGDTPTEANFADLNCALISSGASDAVRIDANAITANRLRLSNCHIEARPATTPKKAINAAAAYNPAPVYNCVLVGGTTNITAAAGTANGTNTEI